LYSANDVDGDDVTSSGRLFHVSAAGWEKLNRQWFEAESVVRPMQRSMMNVGVVGLEV